LERGAVVMRGVWSQTGKASNEGFLLWDRAGL